METDKLYTVLQLCDSAFPTGGFSHSMGIESAFQNHLIKSEDDLKSFIISSLENVGSSAIPFLKLSHENFKDYLKLEVLDSLHNSLLMNHVAYKASIQQGKSFLNTSCNVFQLPEITNLKALVEKEKLHGHLAITFASVCASLQIPAFEMGKMFLFNSLRTIISSLVRLGKVGAIQVL
ncbi:uncharacterized protein LOC129232558 [Uloborus diversus]|uniref:uncharacterized protein LOC129232558 n=1 Tax=Uloborus diversus TaxID=327109 RepID=UPI002409A00C|nr:uncharacterized protein LOC129232558 [Uloborus diversus]